MSPSGKANMVGDSLSKTIYQEVKYTGMSPSGKAVGFGPAIRGFESYHPSQAVH